MRESVTITSPDFSRLSQIKPRAPRILSALAVLIILYLLPSDGIGTTICPTKNLIGVDCPSCGLTRSVSSLLHLEFQKSLDYHYLGAPALLVIAAFFMISLSPGLDKKIAQLAPRLKTRHIWIFVTIIVIATWAFRLLR